jgi:hypothetical protein
LIGLDKENKVEHMSYALTPFSPLGPLPSEAELDARGRAAEKEGWKDKESKVSKGAIAAVAVKEPPASKRRRVGGH